MVRAWLRLGGRAFHQVIEYPYPYPYPYPFPYPYPYSYPTAYPYPYPQAHPGLQWGELPAKWVHEGYVRLCVAKGRA